MNRAMPVGGLSQTLIAQWADQPTRLAVCGRHDRIVNLVTDSGAVMALVTDPQDRGPFHILGSGALLRDPPVWLAWPRIQGRTWTQDCQLLPRWRDRLRIDSPGPHPQGSALPRLLAPILETGLPDTALSLERHCLRHKIRHLQQALAGADLSDAAWDQAVGSLLGLGSGLTPAGDDVLMGLLFILQRLAHHSSFGHSLYVKLATSLRAMPAHRTTRISYQWLWHAAGSDWNPVWHELSAALDTGDTGRLYSAVAALARLGHSSGYYALTGIQTGLDIAGKFPMPSGRVGQGKK